MVPTEESTPVAQARHAPGPWQTRDDMTPDGRCTIIADIDGEYIDGVAHCTFKTVAVCEDEYGERLINAVYNARLIAAAPELLEVLPELLEHSVSHYGNPTDETYGVGLLHAKARAAIAKATGAEQ